MTQMNLSTYPGNGRRPWAGAWSGAFSGWNCYRLRTFAVHYAAGNELPAPTIRSIDQPQRMGAETTTRLPDVKLWLNMASGIGL